MLLNISLALCGPDNGFCCLAVKLECHSDKFDKSFFFSFGRQKKNRALLGQFLDNVDTKRKAVQRMGINRKWPNSEATLT